MGQRRICDCVAARKLSKMTIVEGGCLTIAIDFPAMMSTKRSGDMSVNSAMKVILGLASLTA